MMRSVKSSMVPAVVALLVALPITIGCNNNGPTGQVITPGLTATFTPDAAPADGTVSLQSGAASDSADTFNVNIVVQGVDNASAVTFTIFYNPFEVQYVGADFTQSFLAEGVAADEFEGAAQRIDNAHVDVYASRVNSTANPALGGVPMTSGQQGVAGVLTFRSILATSSPSDLAVQDLVVKVCTTDGVCTNAEVTSEGGKVTAH